MKQKIKETHIETIRRGRQKQAVIKVIFLETHVICPIAVPLLANRGFGNRTKAIGCVTIGVFFLFF